MLENLIFKKPISINEIPMPFLANELPMVLQVYTGLYNGTSGSERNRQFC
jgi:hypothetical protein